MSDKSRIQTINARPLDIKILRKTALKKTVIIVFANIGLDLRLREQR